MPPTPSKRSTRSPSSRSANEVISLGCGLPRPIVLSGQSFAWCPNLRQARHLMVGLSRAGS
eukprot:4051586-Pyramimonas_sp.AAC.1